MTPYPLPPVPVLRLPLNQRGQDYVVGDVHGMDTLLEALLRKLNFNPECDRLLSVGDLVDRGTDSVRALIYLNKPWFHAIRGNHEELLLQHCAAPEDDNIWALWMRNGGDWWQDCDAASRRVLQRWLTKLPLAIEVATAHGPVGIVHADLPAEYDWPGFLQRLQAGDNNAINTALWSRQRAKMWRMVGRVPGVEDVYCGHTIVAQPLSAGNVHFIDTGAYHPAYGKLTAINIHQGVGSAVSVSA